MNCINNVINAFPKPYSYAAIGGKTMSRRILTTFSFVHSISFHSVCFLYKRHKYKNRATTNNGRAISKKHKSIHPKMEIAVPRFSINWFIL